MTGGVAPPRGPLRELGAFLEIQNLGLNLPFALAFLFVAADGLPPWRPLGLAVIAFIGARNAGHAFNRWVDRDLDRENPRTRQRALPSGRYAPRTALLITAVSAAVLVAAAALLNPLALALSPVALAIPLGYSYTKRLGWGTTVALGLVESITPAAAFVALLGTLPPEALVASAGLLLWGTAFETVHSLGDLEADRSSGLSTIPVRFGRERSVRLVPVLHAGAILLFAGFGWAAGLAWPFPAALAVLAGLTAGIDVDLLRHGERTVRAFRLHVLLGAVFLAGTVLALGIA